MTKRVSGFTLIELLGVLTIMAILMAITMPAFKNISKSYKMDSAVRSVAGALTTARQHAILNNATVAFVVIEPELNNFVIPASAVDKCLNAYALYDLTSNQYLSGWTPLPDGVFFDYFEHSVTSMSGLVSFEPFLDKGTVTLPFPYDTSKDDVDVASCEFRSNGEARWRLGMYLVEGKLDWPVSGQGLNPGNSAQYMLYPDGDTKAILVHKQSGRLEILDSVPQ